MPTVPVTDTSMVSPEALPNVQLMGVSPRALMQGEFAGQELEQAGAAAEGAGIAGLDVQAREQALANQVRVNAATNQLRQTQLALTYDPQQGYLSKTGAAAVQPNAQGQGLLDVYGQKLQQAVDTLSVGLSNDAQRQAFAQEAQRIATQFNGQLQDHVLGEYRKFGLQTQQGTVDLASDTAQRNWSNPAVIDQQVLAAKAAVKSAGDIAGEPANLTQAKIQATASGIHMGVIEAALQNNSPQYALAYIAKHKDDMTAGDLLKAYGIVNQETTAQQGTGAAQVVIAAHRNAFQPTDVDRMLEITRQAESGGRDLNADGTPLTSSAGAKYAMQVTDSTAKNPGFGIQPAQADTAAEYNRVGVQYLGALVKQYGGDPAKAWAAYNAGQANVDKAIKDAGPGGDWLSALAKYQSPENHAATVAYVNKNVQQLQNGGGLPQMPTLQQLHDEVRQQLGPNANPQVVKQATDEVTRQFKDAMDARTEQGKQAVLGAQQYLAQNHGDYGSLPPDIRAQVMTYAPEAIPKLQEFAKSIASPPVADNMAAYHTAIEHPDELAKMPDDVFNHFVTTNFSEATQKQIAKLRQDELDGKTDQSAGGLNSRALTATLNNRLTSLGIDTKPKDEAGKERLGTVQKFITDQVFSEQQQLGRKMTAAEIQQFVDQQFLKNEQFHKDYLGGLFSGASQQMPYLSMTVDDIPPDVLTSVKQSLARAGNTNPSNDQILRTYWSKRMQ